MPYPYSQNSRGSAASKFGQMIGESFADKVINLVADYLSDKYPDYVVLSGMRLEMFGGTRREMDSVIALKDSDDPVVLLESKWLKDGRHHNDKGAWILQFREISKNHATVRGAAAILAGFWREGVVIMFRDEAGVDAIVVATDEEIYSTLRQPLDNYSEAHNLEPLTIDVQQIRNSLPRPWDFANCLIELQQSGEWEAITSQWLDFERGLDEQGQIIRGRDLIQQVIDKIITSLSVNPEVAQYEIALKINTGNTIYAEFNDLEDLIEFATNYSTNPKAILDKITPKKRSEK